MYQVDVVFSCGDDAFIPSADSWIVIDVLRATTVITRWFELGGRELYPVKTPDDARNLVNVLKARGSSPLLMGEVNGIPPEGFDLGNSPLDLNYSLIQDHYCGVMSTTNGTVALLQAASSGVPVMAASFRNYAAVLDHSLTFGSRVGLLCSGRKRRPSWEDAMCAGAVIEMLSSHGEVFMSDSAQIALLVWQNRGENLREYVMRSEHAVYLEQIGYSEDIAFACDLNASSVVPMLYTEGDMNILRSASGSSRPYPVNDHTIKPKEIHHAPVKKPDPFEELLTYTKKRK